MPVNYDGRTELRFFYSVSGEGLATLEHRHTVDVIVQELSEVEPGALFENIAVQWWDGTSGHFLDEAVDDYVALMQGVLDATAVDITRVELWKYGAEPSLAADFIAVYELGLNGTNSGVQVNGQYTMTFRTQLGNVMRFQIMEFSGADQRSTFVPPFTPASAADDIVQYLCGTAHPFSARDNSKPIAPIRLSLSQNEKLFRKRYRS